MEPPVSYLLTVRFDVTLARERNGIGGQVSIATNVFKYRKGAYKRPYSVACIVGSYLQNTM